jgi:GNAT superfamily N-acetyltransferase
MSIYHIDPLSGDYNNEILKVLHSAPNVTENLTVCFDRQPDFFRLAEIRYHPYYYYGYFRNQDLKGFCGIGYHDAIVNSRRETVFHMRDYYVSPDARGIGFGLKVTEKFYKETYNKAVVGYVVIMTGNKASLGYVGHRNTSFPYIPYSRIINQLDVRNIMLIWPVRNSRDYIIRKAETKDIPEITDLLNNEHKDRLFGKLFDKSTFQKYLESCPGMTINDFYLALDRKGKPCGVCAAWDCSSFKQTRVLKYGKRFRVLKVLYKGLSVVFNVPSLPAPNECFNDIIITDYAARNRDPGIMNALLRKIYNDYRKLGFHNIMWGSSADDPLLSASKGFFYQRIVSNIVLISTDQSMVERGAIRNNLPYIDLPCL